MIGAIAIQLVCFANKTLGLNSFSVYFSRFSVRTIGIFFLDRQTLHLELSRQTQVVRSAQDQEPA